MSSRKNPEPSRGCCSLLRHRSTGSDAFAPPLYLLFESKAFWTRHQVSGVYEQGENLTHARGVLCRVRCVNAAPQMRVSDATLQPRLRAMRCCVFFPPITNIHTFESRVVVFSEFLQSRVCSPSNQSLLLSSFRCLTCFISLFDAADPFLGCYYRSIYPSLNAPLISQKPRGDWVFCAKVQTPTRVTFLSFTVKTHN